jgi:hypothetical protein
MQWITSFIYLKFQKLDSLSPTSKEFDYFQPSGAVTPSVERVSVIYRTCSFVYYILNRESTILRADERQLIDKGLHEPTFADPNSNGQLRIKCEIGELSLCSGLVHIWHLFYWSLKDRGQDSARRHSTVGDSFPSICLLVVFLPYDDSNQ